MTPHLPWWSTPEFSVDCVLLAGTILVSLLVWRISRRYPPVDPSFIQQGWIGSRLFHAAVPPLQFVAWYYCVYFAVPRAFHLFHPDWEQGLDSLHDYFWHLGLLIGLFWFLFRSVRLLELRLIHAAENASTKAPQRLAPYFYPLVAVALRALIPLVAGATLLQSLPLSSATAAFFWKGLTVLFVVSLGWISQNTILVVENAILGRLDLNAPENYAARGVQTRVGILRNLAVVFNFLITFSCVLMLFDEVRKLGGSLLASAGIVGVILGFAAQQTLGTFFSGLQIALTQPIRLGDWVVVQNESGTVEEITLTYVVIRIWDQRRLVLPISYFITQPFQNWTRTSVALTAVVKIKVDFSMPVAVIRAQVPKWLAEIPEWDRESWACQVTDSDTGSMELRLTASARSYGDAFNLQCALREKVLTHLHENHPESLPYSRQVTVSPAQPPPKA